MEKVAGTLTVLLYFGTVLTTLVILLLVPALLVGVGIRFCRGKRNAKWIFTAVWFLAAYILGGFLGWTFRPFHWSLSFLETLRAQTADHSIEYYAERVLLFVLMTGSMGVWALGIGLTLWKKYSHRRTLRQA